MSSRDISASLPPPNRRSREAPAFTVNPRSAPVAGSKRTSSTAPTTSPSRSLPASWPSFVLTLARKSMRISSSGSAFGPRDSPTLVRNVEVAAAPDARALEKPGESALLAAQRVKQAQRFIYGQVAAEVGQSALDRRWLRRARRRRGARLRAAARSARTARPARSRSWTPPRWRLLSGRRRLPLRVPGLRANELEDLVDQFDVEFRVAVGRIESQRLDVGRARVEDPAQTEE